MLVVPALYQITLGVKNNKCWLKRKKNGEWSMVSELAMFEINNLLAPPNCCRLPICELSLIALFYGLKPDNVYAQIPTCSPDLHPKFHLHPVDKCPGAGPGRCK